MKVILFDFDGTLADTSQGIINAYIYAFNKCRCDVPSENFIKKNIGPPLKETLRILSPDSDDKTIDLLASTYRDYFSKKGLYEMVFYDGIMDLIKKLNISNILGIVSSKPEDFIKKILDRYDLSTYFKYISGVNLGYNNKTKKERLNDLIIENEINRNECFMIGDRFEDSQAAKFAGIKFIGVTYGFGSISEFDNENTVNDVDSLCQLLL